MNEIEIWKTIENYPKYQVSNLGRIKSLNTIDKCGRIQEKIISQRLTKEGYYDCKLCKNGKCKRFLVHRLVAQAFCENPNPLLYNCVDHIDTNRQNSCANNLRWVNHKINQNNPLTLKHMSERQKPTEETKRKISMAMQGEKNPFYAKNIQKKQRKKYLIKTV